MPIAEVQYEETEEKPKYPWFMRSKVTVNAMKLGDSIIAGVRESGSEYLTMRDTKDIYKYENGIYVFGGEDEIKQLTQRTMKDYVTKKAKEEVLDYIRIQSLIDRAEFDKDNGDINLKNGIYNIYSHKFREHSRNDLFTSQFNIVYNPDARCPEIDKFFSTILPEDDAKLIKEEISYCFVPHHRIQKMFIWFGVGDNGKGVTEELITYMFGHDNISGSSMQDFADSNGYARAHLYGKLINLCGDMEKETPKSTNFIKAVTSGTDTVTVRNIFGKPFEFKNRAKMFFSLNEMPDFIDHSHGLFRRFIITPFKFQVTEEMKDVNLINKLTNETEISGFFNQLMAHLKDLLDREKFCKESSAQEIRMKVTRMSDSVESFIVECVVNSTTENTTKDHFYRCYTAYCVKHDIAPETKINLGKMLKKRPYKYKDGQETDKNGDRPTVWIKVVIPEQPDPILNNVFSNKVNVPRIKPLPIKCEA